MRTFLTAMLLLSSVPAFAEDECKIDVGPNDVVKKTGDIVIEAGQYVEDAIAPFTETWSSKTERR